MRVIKIYSHLNGMEYLQVHKNSLIEEILNTIKSVDAEACKTKVSREKTKHGQLFYSPIEMNKAFAAVFNDMGWSEERNNVYVAEDENLARRIIGWSAEQQKLEIEKAGLTPYYSYNQTDFVKERVAVEVQFGKYSFVAHDLFVKHMAFYVGDMIDVGVEILPMKCLEAEMSSGVPYFERDLFNIIRQGRGNPPVPLVIIGVAP